MSKTKTDITTYDSAIIKRKIFNIRGVQVMIDSDLAVFYGVETGRLNEQVKRNKERFPEEFMFQIKKEEYGNLISQIAISSSEHGGRRKLPYVFTEQGAAMLSGVLRSDTAVKMSIQIINAFVEMRRFLTNNASLFQRINTVEKRQFKYETESNEKFEKVFNALQSKDIEPKQGIFFDGQIFDAYKFVSGLIRKAKKSVVLIDNYIDDTVLDLLSKRRRSVNVTIFTKNITKAMALDVEKYNSQYPAVELKKFTKAHDRFLIIDDKDVYHFGASLKDLGKKWFAFSKLDKTALELMQNLQKVNLMSKGFM